MLEGVGRSAEQKLERIEPLIGFYEREMGIFAGRLMLAANFLRDARDMRTDTTPEVAAAIEQAEALTVSVMTRLLARAEDSDRECVCRSARDAAQIWFDGRGIES